MKDEKDEITGMGKMEFFERYMAPKVQEITNLEWFDQFYDSNRNTSDREDCRELFRKIGSLMANHQFDLLDKLLVEIDVSRISTLIMIGVIRYSSSAQHLLPNWIAMLQRSYHEVASRGIDDPDGLFVGLMKYIEK